MKSLVTGLAFGLSLISLSAEAATTVVNLATDKSFYVSGNKAILTAHLVSKPDNANLEFDVTGMLNGQELPVTRITEFHSYSQTAALSTGSYNWTVRVYIQDARLARDLKAAIKSANARVEAIDALLMEETDPGEIAALEAEKAEMLERAAACQAQLAGIRTQIQSKSLTFSVN